MGFLCKASVQQVHIAKYALTNGKKAAILRYTKEFQTEIKMGSVRMWKAKYYVSELKHLVKSSSGNGSRDVAILSLPRLKRETIVAGWKLGPPSKKLHQSSSWEARDHQYCNYSSLWWGYWPIAKEVNKNLLRENWWTNRTDKRLGKNHFFSA